MIKYKKKYRMQEKHCVYFSILVTKDRQVSRRFRSEDCPTSCQPRREELRPPPHQPHPSWGLTAGRPCPLLTARPANSTEGEQAAWQRANRGRCEGKREAGVPEALPSPEYLRGPHRGDCADLPERTLRNSRETSGAMRDPPLCRPLLPCTPSSVCGRRGHWAACE